MKATLLCPGPSLIKYDGRDSGGVTVAVNRAATLHRCDVWAATDFPLIEATTPIGSPALLTISATRDSLSQRGRHPWLIITHRGIAGETVTNSKHPWTRYTTTAALQFLKWVGADHVDVWGCDWGGTTDWDGKEAGENRTESRWADERAIWDLTAIGIDVTRH